MTDQNTTWVDDLTKRFPAMDTASVHADGWDVKALTDHLAKAHDLTLAEAAEAIEDWQAGLSIPASKAA